MATLALIHTVSSLVPVFAELTKDQLPGVATFNIVDESLLGLTIRDGRLSAATRRRLVGYVAFAQEAGADAVLVTCSSVGPAADVASGLVDIPVLRVDEPMADAAIAIGIRVGILATLSITLEPTRELVQRRATRAGRHVEVDARVVPDAFDLLSAGDVGGHDECVARAILDLVPRSDVVMLAQASMARALKTIGDQAVPVLSSPALGVARAGEVLGVARR